MLVLNGLRLVEFVFVSMLLLNRRLFLFLLVMKRFVLSGS